MRRNAAAIRVQLNQRLVREKDRARSRELLRFLFYGAAIAVPLLGYVWQRVDFLRVSYAVERLEKRQQELTETSNQMTVERSTLLGHARIERMARKQLGMIEPAPDDVRRVQNFDGHFRAAPGTVEAGVMSK
jgi:cell division protein FtsL